MYLEMKDLSKSFDGKEVVSGLNLSMNQGEILCLLRKNDDASDGRGIS